MKDQLKQAQIHSAEYDVAMSMLHESMDKLQKLIQTPLHQKIIDNNNFAESAGIDTGCMYGDIRALLESEVESFLNNI